MDFSLKKYKQLLDCLQGEDYTFQPFKTFLTQPEKRAVVLRHDVDASPHNSLAFAKIQHELNIQGVYYFRAVPQSWDEQIIREIADMGHEVGYHYECLSTCKGNMKLAIKDFEKNLTLLRRLVPVSTICMHGSPTSPYDSKDMWKTYSYRDYGIIGEPYFDIDFNKVLYLTDTGRRWNGSKVSVRDKVQTSFQQEYQTTNEVIGATRQHQLPDQVMFNFHPQRWNDSLPVWAKELTFQFAKNIVKKHFYVN